jgi:hypothetical protein
MLRLRWVWKEVFQQLLVFEVVKEEEEEEVLVQTKLFPK